MFVSDVRDVAREMMDDAGLQHPKWVLSISEAQHVSVRVGRTGHIHLPKSKIEAMGLDDIHTMMRSAISIAGIEAMGYEAPEPSLRLPDTTPKRKKKQKQKPTVRSAPKPEVEVPQSKEGLSLEKQITGKHGTFVIWRGQNKQYVIENAVNGDTITATKIKDAYEIARHAANRTGVLVTADVAREERLNARG